MNDELSPVCVSDGIAAFAMVIAALAIIFGSALQ